MYNQDLGLHTANRKNLFENKEKSIQTMLDQSHLTFFVLLIIKACHNTNTSTPFF